jgi:membrane protein
MGRDRLLEGRERVVGSPWRFSFSDWRAIFVRTYREITSDRILAVSGGTTFYTLLAIFPTIAAFVSIYALFADPATIRDHLAVAAGMLPAGAFEFLQGEVTRIASKSNGTLGFAALVSLVIALWSSNSGTKAIFDALDVAYGEKEQRGFIHLNLLSLGFTLGAIAFLLLALAAVAVVPLALEAMGLKGVGTALLALLRWPILLLIVGAALSVLYRYGPSRQKKPRWRWVTPGSLVATLLWLLGSGLFSWYLSHFADYSATYGSLGAVIGFLVWLWLTFIAILTGAELDAEIEHQSKQDRRGKQRTSVPAETAETVRS